MSKRRIHLGMPGYGRQTEAAGLAFWRASADMSSVTCEYRKGSLLASNFNQLWCSALNRVHLGDRLDYFAMLHDDVGPKSCGPVDYWLDMLIEELEAKELDVLSVVVPIKDRRGMTSMALQNPADDWMPHARLSMRDVYQLPETFTAADVGHPLLLNTGCWVAKWNQEWCRTVHFEVRDRIVFNRASNRYQAQTMPEDWHFSQQLNEIGTGPTAHLRPLRIGATRKIAVHHRGEIDFANDQIWGTHSFDAEVVPCSPVPGAWPYEVNGWLSQEEGKALAQFAEGKRVLEIGSYCGLSTICLARTAESVTAVDYFDGRNTPKPADTRAEFDANIARYGLTDKVTVQHPDEPLFGEFDFVFIDGAHDRDSVRADIDKALAVLAPGGLIAFHDYDATNHGVVVAVDEFVSAGASVISTCDSLAVVRPPAVIPLEA